MELRNFGPPNSPYALITFLHLFYSKGYLEPENLPPSAYVIVTVQVRAVGRVQGDWQSLEMKN